MATLPPIPTSSIPVARRKEESIWNREIELGKAFGPKEKQSFFELLAVLLEAGLSITESLEVIEGQSKRRQSRKIVQQLLGDLHGGAAFSEAIAGQSAHFDAFEINSLRMGERSGEMPLVLKELALYHEKRQKLQKKVTQALAYPMVVLLVAGGVMFFMVNYVVPMFSEIFQRFDTELPVLTQWVIALSDFTQSYGWALALVLVLGVVVVLQVRKRPWAQRLWGETLRRLPLLGGLVMKVQLARFCGALGLMLRSHVALDQALELLEQVVQFHPLRRTIGVLRKDVEEGSTLGEAISRHSIYPANVVQMVRVGERSAKLDQMMVQVAKRLEEESEASINLLTSLLEPLLIVVLGLVVGLILISMYLPMFELGNTINA